MRVHLAGVCGTDRAMVAGYKGGFRGVLGHEFVGTVESGPPEWVGRRVVAEINCACAQCQPCDTQHCVRRTVLGILGRDGAFAERLAVPVANLHAVPDSVSDRAAVFTEPLAAALAVRALVDSAVLVAGDGPLGALIGLSLPGATVCGRHPEKLQVLRQLGVATLTWEEALTRRWPAAVDATGSPDALPRLLEVVEPRGKLVLKTTSAHPVSLDTSPIVVKELQVLGSRCGAFAPALQALAEGFPVEALIARVVPLSPSAVLERQGLKTLIDVNL